MDLRPYQADLKTKIYNAWAALHTVVMAVLPTGGGKTVLLSKVVLEHNGPSCIIAHRKELICQISLALARDKIRHRIIGPESLVRLINRIHVEELGASYYHPNATTAVAGVDTLVQQAGNKKANGEAIRRWAKTVTLVIQDEGHHVIAANKWGKAVGLFPNAKCLLVTATPHRADGKGLGRHADGVVDALVEGPSLRDLISMGYLTEYQIFAPPSDLDLTLVPTGANGDWTKPGVKKAIRKSRILGDVVKHYLRIAPGKLGVTFATDVETATEIAAEYNAAGVPAAVVSAKTPDAERVNILRQFKQRKLLQLVNVDLFGEGFDLPAIEVVSLARPTKSFALFVQQCGRALRRMDGKEFAIIIDHVGNVQRHASVTEINGELVIDLCRREWTLDRQDRRSRTAPSDVIPTRTCLNPTCVQVYPAVHSTCPYCGFKMVPGDRSKPELVDGDLAELSPEALADLQGAIDKVERSVADYLDQSGANYKGHIIASSLAKKHLAHQAVLVELQASIAMWAGQQRALGRPDSESWRRFFFLFGMDVLSAQALRAKEMKKLHLVVDASVNMAYK